MPFTPITEFTGTITAKKDYAGARCRVVGINDDGEFVVLIATSEGDLRVTSAYFVRPDCESEVCPKCTLYA
ncbi:hypothetical protein OF122_11305 [Pelagibacterium flavum]|uniref:Uncharacterized protein n=1 Tax=Pelagibacterium flavum TaxID=2984530 RepID=A0ABY6IJK3_9HYPH|nr:hypothetical protein [Pelagibacterium sp. YIM 151497]UYQ70661.1 hypothetical protein OF122_11305 [Pelagibacterium sp. YIM 151497]